MSARSALKSYTSPTSHFTDGKDKAYEIIGKLEPNSALFTALSTLPMIRIVFARQGGEMHSKRDIHVRIMHGCNTQNVRNSMCSVIRETFSEIQIDLQDYFQVREWDVLIPYFSQLHCSSDSKSLSPAMPPLKEEL